MEEYKTGGITNKVLRRIFGAKGDEMVGVGEN
jgi:hypothetical protein